MNFLIINIDLTVNLDNVASITTFRSGGAIDGGAIELSSGTKINITQTDLYQLLRHLMLTHEIASIQDAQNISNDNA